MIEETSKESEEILHLYKKIFVQNFPILAVRAMEVRKLSSER